MNFLDNIIKLSVKNNVLVIVLTFLIAALGFQAFKQLPIDAVPDITNVQVQVNTAVTGLIPEEIENLITYPIESKISGLPGVSQVRSITRFGLSQVTVVFEEGTDIYLARQLVNERLQSIKSELPHGLNPELGPISSGLGEIYFYALKSKDLLKLRAFNKYFIKPRLLTVKGVAEVNAIGGFEKQYHVQPNIEKLSQYGIHLHDITEAIKKNNRNTGGGYLEQTAEQLLVQAVGLIKNKKDIENIVIKRLPSLQVIKISDVAEVNLGKELRTGAALVNGEEAVIGTVLMLLGENSRLVSERVDKKILEIQKTLPDWVKLESLYTRAELVDNTLNTVQKNLLYGALLVVFVLLLMLGNFRAALITAIVIPLSLLITFIFMRVFNVSGNLMSLGALDFGIIIDGAVIVIDNCYRHLSDKAQELKRDLSKLEIKENIVKATLEIRSAAGFGQLIIIIVFLPIFALEGVEAKMFMPMAATFCFALFSAFVLSFTAVPALASIFLKGKYKNPNLKKYNFDLIRLVNKFYEPILNLALKFKFVVICVGVCLVALGYYSFSNMGANFLPQLDEGSIAIQFVRPTNISIAQSVEMQKESEKIILEFPQVRTVLSRVGTAEVATDPMGPNLSDTYILLAKRLRKSEKQELIKSIESKLEAHMFGQSLIFSQPIQLRFNELLEGVRADVALKIYGQDAAVIFKLAEEAARIIREVPGAGDVEEEVTGTSPVLKITPIAEEIIKLGIPKENILSTVEIAIGGEQAGYLYDGVQKFPIIVRLNDTVRSDIENIKQLPVGLGDNLTAPMFEVADISIEETYGEIKRENAQKRAAVLINVRDRDTASFIVEAKQLVAQELVLPEGYYVEWGGSFKNLESAKQKLYFVVPVALILVFMLIYLAFGSLVQTLLIFLCVPMALVGGVFGLILNNLEFSISAAIGFIALSGIAVLNGVVLVSYFNSLKLSNKFSNNYDNLIKQGVSLRLRPVLMTALTDIFGFLPMMLATGAGAEVQRPLAAVVVGGIVSATILTLLVLPVLYRMLLPR